MLRLKNLLLREFVLMHMTTVDWCKIWETQYYFVTLLKSHLHKSTFLIFWVVLLLLACHPPLLILNMLFEWFFLTKYLSGNIPATLQGFFGSIIPSNLHGMCVSKLALRAWALSNIAQWRWTHHWKLLYVDYQQNNYKSKANRSLAKPLNVRCSSYGWRRALPHEASYGQTKWNPANLAQVSLLKPW